jgi:TatD DNase family protein
MLVDTHCHLNEPSLFHALPQVISRARAQGVTAFIVPSYDGKSLARTALLAHRHPDTLFPAYGIHPWHVEDSPDLEEVRLHAMGGHAVAIGEIGLDFSPDLPSRQTQEKVLAAQLDLAVELGLPVLIHCRKAHEALHGMLAQYRKRLRGVMHSFSGSLEQMEWFLELDFYIAFSGSVTRSTAKRYHKNALHVPAGRMLLETDAPSIATETTPASEVEPFHVVEVAGKLAELRGVSYEEICSVTTENAARLFSLSRQSGGR